MASNTPNLNLRKADGADLVDVVSDLDANFDKIDAVGAWTPFAAAISGAGVAIGNGSIICRYRQVGKLVHFHTQIKFGTTSTYGAAVPFQVSVPVVARAGGVGGGIDVFGPSTIVKTASGSYSGSWQLSPGSNQLLVLCPTGPASSNMGYVQSGIPSGAWANGDFIDLSGFYEAA